MKYFICNASNKYFNKQLFLKKIKTKKYKKAFFFLNGRLFFEKRRFSKKFLSQKKTKVTIKLNLFWSKNFFENVFFLKKRRPFFSIFFII